MSIPKWWRLSSESLDTAVRRERGLGHVSLSVPLTFARSWDTILALEGPLCNRSFRRNDPFADFVCTPPHISVRDVPDVVRERIIERIRGFSSVLTQRLEMMILRPSFWP